MLTNLNASTNKDSIWRQVIEFVKEERWDGEFTRETDLVKDLKLKGDDAYEFICLYSKKFDVDISEFNFGNFFYPEGDWIFKKIVELILKQKSKNKKSITLGDLERGIKDGKII